MPISFSVTSNLQVQNNLTVSSLASAILRVDSSGLVSTTTLQSNLSLSAGTLSLASALTSINSITSAAGQNLVLATATSGTALTIASSTLAATFATNLLVSGATEVTSATDATGAFQIVGGASIGKSLNVGFGSPANTYPIAVSGNGGTNYVSIGGGAASKIQAFASGGTATTFQVNPLGGAISFGTTATVSTFNGTAASTSTTTGAVVVSGGLGVAGAIYVGGNVVLVGGTGALSIVADATPFSAGTARPFAYSGNGQVYIKGDAGTWSNSYHFRGSANTQLAGFGAYGAADALTYLWIGAAYDNTYMRFTSTAATVAYTTSSTSTTTGALVVSGGLGVAGQANIGANLSVTASNGVIAINGTGNTSENKEFRLVLSSGGDWLSVGCSGTAYAGPLTGLGNNEGYIYSPGTFRIFRGTAATNRFDFSSTQFVVNSTTASTSTATGAVVISGGLGVAGAIYVGGAVLSTSASSGIGYATGAGGSVTQSTSKSTGVTLDKICGQINMNNATLNAGTSVSFTLTNSTIAIGDVVIVNIGGSATANSYSVQVDQIGAGSCRIQVRNISGSNLGEALNLFFAVIKGVTS